MWNFGVSATTRRTMGPFILMCNRWFVFCTDDPGVRIPKEAYYLALVTDYGDYKGVRFYDQKMRQQKALLYRLGQGKLST